MKSYPSISRNIQKDIYCFLQSKIDGSNIFSTWNNKQGFYKFGTRTRLIDESSKPFNIAIDLIKEKYSDHLSEIFSKQKYKEVNCYFELYGKDSCFGRHNFEEPMTITLIDVNPYKQGIISINKFIDLFKYIDIPPVLYEGYITDEVIEKVKNSDFENLIRTTKYFEGVVAKSKHQKISEMFKIKSNEWLNALKTHCNGDEKLFEQLK